MVTHQPFTNFCSTTLKGSLNKKAAVAKAMAGKGGDKERRIEHLSVILAIVKEIFAT